MLPVNWTFAPYYVCQRPYSRGVVTYETKSYWQVWYITAAISGDIVLIVVFKQPNPIGMTQKVTGTIPATLGTSRPTSTYSRMGR